MRRVLDIYSICQLLGCSQGPSVPHWHMIRMSRAREWKHRCSYKSKVQMTSRWGLWNYGFAMLNSFFKKIIFNGTQETAVCKAIPYAKAWVRFNSEPMQPMDLWMWCKGDSVFNNAAPSASHARQTGRAAMRVPRLDAQYTFSHFLKVKLSPGSSSVSEM